jgi:hypothetical protein
MNTISNSNPKTKEEPDCNRFGYLVTITTEPDSVLSVPSVNTLSM